MSHFPTEDLSNMNSRAYEILAKEEKQCFLQHILLSPLQQDDAMVSVIGQFSDHKDYPY